MFSPDGTLISASAAPHCGNLAKQRLLFESACVIQCMFPFRNMCTIFQSHSQTERERETETQRERANTKFVLHRHYLHLSLRRGGRRYTTDDFTTIFLHFSLTALWDLPNSSPVHSTMLSSHLFLRLPRLLPSFTVPCKMVLARPDERETCPYHCRLRLFTICLLYTSPSPRDLGQSRMPSSA